MLSECDTLIRKLSETGHKRYPQDFLDCVPHMALIRSFVLHFLPAILLHIDLRLNMATLRATHARLAHPLVAPLLARTGKPFLCSNICLAWALLDELGLVHLAPPEHPGEVLIGGWTPRLSRL